MKRRIWKEELGLNKIILIEEMNQLYRNYILILFNEYCDIANVFTYMASCSKLPPALAMHKQARFKTSRVTFLLLSRLYRMRAAPYKMGYKGSCRVCDFP
jgi:hypothetical protein